MDNTPLRADASGGDAPASETEAERQARLAWEAERIAEARADVAGGRVLSFDEVDAWLQSIGTNHELPRPRPRD